MIVDCVPDELESKLEIFSMMDRMAPPRAIFVSPIRDLSIADLASCTYRPDRCVAVGLPAELSGRMQKLSVVVTSQTSPEVVDAVTALWRACGFDVSVICDPQEATFAISNRP